MAEHDWVDGSNPGIQPVSEGVYGGAQPAVRHELRPLTTGEILDRTFFLYKSDFWLYVGLASIAAAVNVLTAIVRLGYLHLRGIPETSPKAVLAGSILSVWERSYISLRIALRMPRPCLLSLRFTLVNRHRWARLLAQ